MCHKLASVSISWGQHIKYIPPTTFLTHSRVSVTITGLFKRGEMGMECWGQMEDDTTLPQYFHLMGSAGLLTILIAQVAHDTQSLELH